MAFPLNQGIYISNLTCWYQPIFKLDTMDVFGFEALVRSKVHRNFNAMELFYQAQIQRNLTILDYQLILKAQQLFKFKNTYTLFINIFPSTLLDKRFMSWWQEFSGIVPSIVLELSEEEPINDWKTIKSVIRSLKACGVKIAVDEMGEGYSFLRHWMKYEPDLIKLDRRYMVSLIENKNKQMAIKNLVSMVNSSAEIVAEGVEHIECVDIIRDLGIQYAQGYALGRPAPLNNFFIKNLK